MTNKLLVLTTTASRAEARKIASALVERKLAACVNIIANIESVYRWKGKVENAEEWLLFIKTDRKHFPKVRDAIKELHSYELPECIAFTITEGSKQYLQWLSDSLI